MEHQTASGSMEEDVFLKDSFSQSLLTMGGKAEAQKNFQVQALIRQEMPLVRIWLISRYPTCHREIQKL